MKFDELVDAVVLELRRQHPGRLEELGYQRVSIRVGRKAADVDVREIVEVVLATLFRGWGGIGEIEP